MDHPAVEPLRRLSRRLADHGVDHALGGSGLRWALGEDVPVRDWDLTTDAPVVTAHRAIVGLPHELLSSSPPWASTAAWRLHLDGTPVDLVVGFAVHGPDGVVPVPTRVGGTWGGIPLGDPVAWARAMAAVGR